MKKHLALLFTMMVLALTVTGCSKDTAVTNGQMRAVTVQKVLPSEKAVDLNYIGTLDAKKTINYSFKSAGQIGRVFVENGDHVKTGDKLMELDTQDLDYQVSAAQSSLDTAELNVSQAKDSVTYSRTNLNRMKQLYTQNALSKDAYEQVELAADSAENSLSLAQAQYDSAVKNYNYQLSLRNDATIYAEQDGTVASIISRENERVNALTPVISVRSAEEAVNIGIPQQDLNRIQVGSRAEINIDGQTAPGIITKIDEAPDTATRTYKAEVTVQGKEFRLGSIAKVAIDIGSEKGVWIPLTAVLSDGGEDYVYTIKGSRAFKRTIDIQKQSEDKILVKGLKSGDILAISSMKNLDDGTKVKIIN